MKKLTILASLFIFTFLTAHNSFAGGPWAIGKDKGFVQFGATFLNYSKAYNGSGSNNSIGTEITDNTFQLYTEYGLSDRFTLKSSLPFKSLENSTGSVTLSGLGNWVVGGKYLLVNKKVKLSFGSDFSLPTVSVKDNNGLRTGYEALGVTPYLSVGGGKQNLYAFVETGVNFNTSGYSTNFMTTAEVGFAPINGLWVAAFTDVRQSFEDGDFQETDAPEYAISNLYVNDQSYVVSGVKLAYEYKNKFGINASRVFSISSAENVAGALPFNVGVYAKW